MGPARGEHAGVGGGGWQGKQVSLRMKGTRLGRLQSGWRVEQEGTVLPRGWTESRGVKAQPGRHEGEGINASPSAPTPGSARRPRDRRARS